MQHLETLECNRVAASQRYQKNNVSTQDLEQRHGDLQKGNGHLNKLVNSLRQAVFLLKIGSEKYRLQQRPNAELFEVPTTEAGIVGVMQLPAQR